MIRVFLLAVVGLAALVILAGHLPPALRPPAAPAAGAASGPAAGAPPPPPAASWEGDWRGSLTTYRADGTPEETIEVLLERRPAAPAGQRVVISQRLADGRTRVLTGEQTLEGGRLAYRITNPDGTLTLYDGRRDGDALIWHRRDALAGVEETLREEIVPSAGGDLYMVDGFRLTERGGRAVRLIEGRYRRVARSGA